MRTVSTLALAIWAGVSIPCAPADAAEPGSMRRWALPDEGDTVWRLGNSDAAWAVSKATGQVVGGWNAKIRERYLVSLEGRYHVEDRQSLVTGRESEDEVLSAQFDDEAQRIELTCSNPTVPDLAISKQYWLEGNKLYQRVGFTTKSNVLKFITYNSQAAFDPAYRDGGYYMGGADGGGPLLPAPDVHEWQKVLAYQNTTKGMVLHQPQAGYGFAHIRTRLDDRFVWPWFTGAVQGYVEQSNALHYTPDGWDMSLGTSRLSADEETVFEQYLSVFEGDWQRFLTHEYPATPGVQEAFDEIPPVPDWVSDVKLYTGIDTRGEARLRRLVEMTDEGTIMVLIDLGGNWADYYVDQGLEGGLGGHITGEETRDLIRRIKAISPRIKVGIYMWVLSAFEHGRIYTEHPEWFRTTNKDGEPFSTFPGMATNFAQLLSVQECYDELLSQFDLVLEYLDTDFIYLDDPKAINLIDWNSGEFTRDDLSFQFFLEIKRIAAKHGPDKVVFFNNRGNPYGDINFIEARSQLRAGYWRHFAGIATIAETFLTLRPKARIIPLYYTPPLARDYVNRVLALGWIPSLQYGDGVARRAWAQAAYELGNCTVAPVGYSPDWKRTKDTTVESYGVQRQGDSGYLLSFINHAEEPAKVPVQLDGDSFELDPGGRVFVWEYAIEDAGEFAGCATEELARSAYAGTGWQLDRVTRRKLVYAGPWRKQLDLDLELEPLLLHQLYVTAQPAAVYSEDDLPANYLFGQVPNVQLRGTLDPKAGSVEIEIDSRRNEAEIIVFLPLTRHRLDRVSLDTRPVEPAFVWEGDGVFPVVRVSRGHHQLSLAFAPRPKREPLVARELAAAESLTGIRVRLPGFTRALFTVEQDGRALFNRMAARAGEHFVLPFPAARSEEGEYTVSLRAVVDDEGRLRLAEAAQAPVHLAAALPDLGLGRERTPIVPGTREIVDVNRTVRGLSILRSATLTTATEQGSIQPHLPALMARVEPDELLLEAGTTRKIEQGSRGAAFAGLELEDLRKVQVRLSNTFHDAFHYRGEGFHVPPKPYSGNFAGIVVDYHTPEGYSKRVRFATGVMYPECTSRYPDYGKYAVADEARDLGSSLIEVPETTFALDLEQFAPEGWDGLVWLSAGSDWVASDRRLTLEILAANEAVSGDFLTGTDPNAIRAAYNQPRTLEAARASGDLVIDGSPDEEPWARAGRTDEFFLLQGTGISEAGTTAMVLYDEEDLYVAFVCAEPGRSKPLIKGGAAWGDDEVEVWIDASGDGKTFRQVIVSAANDRPEYSETGPTRIGATSATDVVEGEAWTVEIAIPFAGLNVDPPNPGESWRLSLCRGRPAGRGFGDELIVWAPLQELGFRDLENFGTLVFR